MNHTHNSASLLFDLPVVVSPSSLQKYGIQVRSLELGDFEKGFCEVLSQLTTVGNVTKQSYAQQFIKIQEQKSSYIIVAEDIETNAIVGAGTLALEHKFIHNCGTCGHIEDIVVDSKCRGKGLGLVIIQELVRIGDALGCYKILLDCSEQNKMFYERCGFEKKEIQMVKYLPHNEKINSSL